MHNTLTVKPTKQGKAEVNNEVHEVRRHYSFLSKLLMRLKANSQAHKIIKGLNEAKEIHAGSKKGKSFSEFLKEI